MVGEMGASVAWRQPQKVRVLRVGYERRLLVLWPSRDGLLDEHSAGARGRLLVPYGR